MRKIGLEKQTLAGMLAMAAAMGFGRFAFTPLLPLMIAARTLTLDGASALAAANYAGYLLGSLLATLWPVHEAARLARLCLALTLACLAGMALTSGLMFWLPLRTLAGMGSAGVMVAASTLCLRTGHSAATAPVLYAGVGMGIMLSAWLIALAQAVLAPDVIWGLCALATLLLGGWPWHQFDRSDDSAASVPARLPDIAGLNRVHWVGLYALAGFGYIVGATYLPQLLHEQGYGAGNATLIWSLFGLAAIPSCALWFGLLLRVGPRRALAANLALQALGAALPLWRHAGSSALLGAVCLGGGFMGTVVIAMPVARRMQTGLRFNLLGLMTCAYGLGQIAGPLCTRLMLRHGAGLEQALALSALLLACGAVSLWPVRHTEK